MAQDLSTIFSGSLGSTELESDNEHTLVTTNSSTTHIVKAVYVSNPNGINLGRGAGTYLELNGHKLADVGDSGLTGELIIPPSSTLKLINHSYPVEYEYRRSWFKANNSGRLYLTRTIHDKDTGDKLYSYEEFKSHTTSLGRQNEIIDVQKRYARTVLHYMTHDNNSVQTIRGVGIDGLGTGSDTQLVYENYKAMGFGTDRWTSYTSGLGYTVQAYKIDNGYWQWADIGNNNSGQPDIANWNNIGAIANRTAAGQIQVNPTSSYPRGMVVLSDTDSFNGMWFFWIPSSGYSNDIYAFSTEIKQNFRFQFPRGWGGGSGNYNFGVSIDKDNDQLIFWRPQGQNNINRHACTTPWSTLTSTTQIVSTTSPIMISSSNFTDDANLPLNQGIDIQGMGGSVISNRLDGGFAHKGSDGCLHHYDSNGNFKYKDDAFSSANDGNITGYYNGYPWAFRARSAPGHLLTAAGLSSPTFDLSLHGYTIS